MPAFWFGLLADITVVLHLGFVLFVVAGGLLVLRWRRLAWVHVPCALWGALIELAGWVCPLTPLELWLRARAGEAGYGGGFVEHYVLPVLYPGALTRGVQVALGVAVLAVNAAVYGWIWHRARWTDRGALRDPR
jgi:hypothetical protein